VFLAKIANLFLQSEEGTKDWVSVRQLRLSWYLTCGVSVAYAVLWVARMPFEGVLMSCAAATLVYRLGGLVLEIALEASVMLLAAQYFRFALSRKVAIRLGNIVVLYAFSTLLFGAIYASIYLIDTNCFVFSQPPFVVKATVGTGELWAKLVMQMQFFIFSGLQSIGGSFYRIQGHSIFVSALGYIQSVFSIALLSLLIAYYVNRESK
jgi:hypothetical protein